MSRIKRNTQGLGYMVAGAVFLFDPFFSVFDLLPDLIGYLLILRGLRNLTMLEGHFEEASRLFRRLLLLAAVRIVSVAFIFGLTPASEQPVWLLLVPFTLAILDCIVLYPAWQELAQGLTQLAYLHNGHAPLESDRYGASHTDRLLRSTLKFMTVREVLAFLPEASVLLSNVGGEDTQIRWSFLYTYIGILRLFAVIIGLVCGIVWLTKVVRYARGVRRDTAFLDSLQQSVSAYAEIHPDYIGCRDVRRSLLFAGMAAVLTIDIYVEGINLLSNALVGVFALCAVISLPRRMRRLNPEVASSSMLIVCGTYATVVQSTILHGFASDGIADGSDYSLIRHPHFLENASRMLKSSAARKEFYIMCGLVLLSQICLVLLLFVLRRMLNRIVDRYAGPPLVRENDPRLAGAEQEIRTRLKARIRNVTIAGCVIAIFPVLYMVTLPYALGTFLETVGLGPVCFVLQVIFAVAYVRTLIGIRRQIDTRYLLA